MTLNTGKSGQDFEISTPNSAKHCKGNFSFAQDNIGFCYKSFPSCSNITFNAQIANNQARPDPLKIKKIVIDL